MMKMMSTLALVPLLAAGCQTLTEPLPEPAAFEGIVTAVIPGVEGRVELRLEAVRAVANPDAEFHEYPGRVTVHVGPGTKIFGKNGEELTELQASDIQIGVKVHVWADVELRSDPPQYPANQIVIQVQ